MPSHPVSLRSTVKVSTYLCLGLQSDLLPSGLPHQSKILLGFMTQIMFGNSTSDETPHYTVLSNLLLLSLGPRFFPQDPILERSRPVFLIRNIITTINMPIAVRFSLSQC